MSGERAPRRTTRAGATHGGDGRTRLPPFEAALQRALRHARSAAAEAARAAGALLDAASLGATGVPAGRHEALRPALRWLETLADGDDARDGRRWLAALAAALDAEIERWEARSRTDPEARGVLRAFLGLRELLWELGVRAAPGAPEAAPRPRSAPRGSAARGPRPRTPAAPEPATREPATREAATREAAARAQRARGTRMRRLERVPIEGGGPADHTG